MKNHYLIILSIIILIPSFINAQTRRCAAEEWTADFKQSPEYPRLMKNLERVPEWKSSAGRGMQFAAVPDTIAVVVHVLWANATQNIPDSVIFRQLEILNLDYPRLNSDTVNTPTPFAAIAGRANFRFQLARRDFNGAISNGIVRKQTSHGPFSNLLDLIQSSMGGDNAWGGYLNIYCVDIEPSTGAAGIAMLGSSVCMIDYQYFGLNSPLAVGRVATHEVGHCFGLKHIWGSEPQQGPFDCANDDDIADTPPQYEPGSVCGTFPKLDSCTTSGDGIMFMNYMDYTIGACQNMFSNGQMVAMNNTITNSLPDILNAPGLIPVPPYDAGCPDILEPTGTSCGAVHPVVVVRNWGSMPLSSLTIYYQVDNNAIDSATWNGNLLNYETDTISLATLNVSAGNHTIKVYTVGPNGNQDEEPLNDTSYSAFISGNSLAIPVVEGFENNFPPNGWSFNSPDTAFGFRSDPNVAFSGTKSMVFYSRNNNSYTAVIEASLQTSFSNIIAPFLSFDYAHTNANCCGDLDTLDILISSDCGQHYTIVSRQFGNTIMTAPIVTVFSNLFIPTLAQWSNKFIDLSAYAGSQDVTIKFRLINMWGLQLYLDNINIADNGLGMVELTKKSFRIYPNPTNGRIITEGGNKNYDVAVYQSNGRLIYSIKNLSGKKEFDSGLSQGIYYLKISDEDAIQSIKMIVE